MSTHTVSPSESSLSPHSLISQTQDNRIVAVDPDNQVTDEFDGDDVSYRLRLLVKNSYFLPPAHSKPSSSDLTPPLKAQKLSSRAGTPTFLDLFRLGRSRSRPSTPSSSTTAVESCGPMLRTTSDTVTANGCIPRMQARPMPRSPSQPFYKGAPKDPTGRVVVVREVMEDLITAAKEAEQDMKVREWRNSQILSDGFLDVVDPTDAVDLPPPSAGYPFAVQSTATHGLGVQQSVCAADLADRLPPPNTSGDSSLYPPDDAWRRALLHEAVGHSLNNSSSESMLSKNLGAQTSLASPTPERQLKSNVGHSMLKRALDRRIISQPVIEDHETSSHDVTGSAPPDGFASTSKSRHTRGLSTPDSPDGLRRLSYVPRRAETPTALHTPLAPPPRSLYSTSQTNLINPETGQLVLSPPPRMLVRKAKSSPAISDAFESCPSTPPVPALNISPSPVPMRSHHALGSVSTSSFYSEDDHEETCESAPRPSMALSAPTSDGRYSLFDNDRHSPAVSAFGDMQYSGYYTNPESSRGHMSRTSRDAASSASPRYSTMSPPPRASTSMSNTPLFPPPRSSSLHFKVVTTRATPTTTPSPTSSHYTQGLRSLNIPLPSHPESLPQSSVLPPQSPPSHPLASRRGGTGPAPLFLNVNISRMPITIHSAPPPASPASFFDNIHDGMHDLESSEESYEGSDFGNDADLDTTMAHEPLRPRAMSSSYHSPTTPPRPSFPFARLGNQSTPNVARHNFSPNVASFSPTLGRFSISHKKHINHKPISNVPPRTSFFSGRKVGRSPNKSPLEYVNTMQLPQPDELLPPPSLTMGDSRSSFSRSITGSDIIQDGQKDESLRKLDGMMVEHMEAEKDRIRKIARTFHESKS